MAVRSSSRGVVGCSTPLPPSGSLTTDVLRTTKVALEPDACEVASGHLSEAESGANGDEQDGQLDSGVHGSASDLRPCVPSNLRRLVRDRAEGPFDRVFAAVSCLPTRPDVDPDGIAAVGLSMGEREAAVRHPRVGTLYPVPGPSPLSTVASGRRRPKEEKPWMHGLSSWERVPAAR